MDSYARLTRFLTGSGSLIELDFAQNLALSYQSGSQESGFERYRILVHLFGYVDSCAVRVVFKR